MIYRRSQTARWTLAVGAVAVVALVVSALGGWADDAGGLWWYVPLAFIVVVVMGVSRLDVAVDAATVAARFRFGWPARRIARSDIAGVRRVRVRWYHGWGIRKVRRGWMYNVAGFDAVELELRSGRVFWIGTDDPDGLLAALQADRHR